LAQLFFLISVIYYKFANSALVVCNPGCSAFLNCTSHPRTQGHYLGNWDLIFNILFSSHLTAHHSSVLSFYILKPVQRALLISVTLRIYILDQCLINSQVHKTFPKVKYSRIFLV